MTVVWGMNRLGAGMDSPINPPIFMRRLLYQSHPDFRHYFIGETEECSNRLRERMLRRNPDIDLVGSFHGPCSTSGYLQPPEVHDRVLKDVRSFCVGGNRQQRSVRFHCQSQTKDGSGILLAMGSAFEVNAGIQPEAPPFMQQHRLACLYHLLTEPAHFLGTNVKYYALLLFDLLTGRGSVD